MTVTFCGHSKLDDYDKVKAWLKVETKKLILSGATDFYLGGYGDFDYLAAMTLTGHKANYPHITRTLVIPYLNREYDMTFYDDSLYPPIESTPLRYAILKRNEWMVDNADLVVACVRYIWGGAAKTLEYANRRKKR